MYRQPFSQSRGSIARFCLTAWVVLFAFGLNEDAFADRTGGTNTTVSSITQNGATFTASITTDGVGAGNYELKFFVTAPFSNYIGGVTPSTVAKNSNTTTTFSATTTALSCGTTYTVAGVYLPDNFTVGTGYISFTTSPCTSTNPVPTLSEWALILFGSLMAGAIVWYQRRRV